MADWYINADTGNDTTGNGSSGSPYLTADKADQVAASSGDTIWAQTATATYAMTGLTGLTKSWTLRSVSGDPRDAVFDGAAATAKLVTNATGITTIFRDVTVQNLNSTNDSAFQAAANSWNCQLINCIFDDLVFDPANSSGGLTSCFVSTGCTFSIVNCKFKNCSLVDQGNRPVLLGTHQVSVSYVITGNVFYLTATGTNQILELLSANAGTLTSVWKNNIIENVGGTLSTIAAGTVTYQNNCAHGTITTIPSGTGNITSDPKLQDPANNNFELDYSSPCLGIGQIL